jgi:hypothetical protein
MPNSTDQSCNSATEATKVAIEPKLPAANATPDLSSQRNVPRGLQADDEVTAPDLDSRIENAKKSQSVEPKIPDRSSKWLRIDVKSPAWHAEKERLVGLIRECAETLGRAPTQFELSRMTEITRYMVQKYFGPYAQAMSECGLEFFGAGVKQPIGTLFEDWARVTRELGRAPKVLEYSMRSRFSVRPLTRRFGSWNAATDALLKYAKENGRESELGIIGENGQTTGATGTGGCTGVCTSGLTACSTAELNRLPYGESLNPFPMAHAPTNETGVVFAFGMLARELGFVILSMQAAYPDCIALRWMGENSWRRLRIEIEFQSMNFVKHRHDLAGCDLIVCWEDNWPECPVEVVELRKVVKNRVIG